MKKKPKPKVFTIWNYDPEFSYPESNNGKSEFIPGEVLPLREIIRRSALGMDFDVHEGYYDDDPDFDDYTPNVVDYAEIHDLQHLENEQVVETPDNKGVNELVNVTTENEGKPAT